MKNWGVLQFIGWILMVAGGITLIFCIPLIWQHFSQQPIKQDAEAQKWLAYLILLWLAKWLLADPIADKLREIAAELKEFNQRERLKL